MGLNGAAFRSTLLLGGATWRFEEVAAGATFELTRARWTFSFGAGALLGGRLESSDESVVLGPGGLLSAGAAYALLKQDGAVPFVVLGGSASGSAASAPGSALISVDLRVSATAGYTLWERLTPYLTARLFGGPVFFRGTTGSDAHHYQLGAGLVLLLPGGLDVSAELVPLGEQRVSASVGYSF